MRAIKITVDGKKSLCEINDYDDLKAAVEGWIEAIPIGRNANAYINEEGKLRQLPVNLVATELALRKRSIRDNDYIVGNMVIVGPLDAEGNDTDVPESLLAELQIS